MCVCIGLEQITEIVETRCTSGDAEGPRWLIHEAKWPHVQERVSEAVGRDAPGTMRKNTDTSLRSKMVDSPYTKLRMGEAAK